ncbi:hypothetical protein DPMN_063539, partial [Dreissena polymorpha]
VVVVFLSSAPGLSPIWPSPPERRVNTGDTPFQSTLHLAGDRTSDLWITTDPLLCYIVVVVFLSSAPGLSPIWPSPPERRVNTGDTPFQSTYGGSNQ